MKETLQKIANIITLNVHNISNWGLFEGKMGIALFYYHYADYTSNIIYSEIADKLLDQVLDELKSATDITFDQGITGISWAIRYMTDLELIEGDPNEILYDIDNQIFNRHTNDCQSKIDISSLGLYLQYIISNKHITIKKEKVELYINTVLRKYELYYLYLSKPKTIRYINSTLILLNKLIIYENKDIRLRSKKLLYKILTLLEKMDFSKNVSDEDLIILLQLLSIENNLYSDKRDNLLLNIKNYISSKPSLYNIVDGYWYKLIYTINNKTQLNLEKINRYIDDNYACEPDKDKFSLYKGLSGIGLELMKQDVDNRN